MSSDESSHVPAQRNRREAVREKAQQVQARQSRHRWLRRVAIALAVVIVVAAATTAVIWAVGSTKSKPLVSPRGASDDGFVVNVVTGVPAGDAGAVAGTESPAAVETPAATSEPTPAPTESAAPGSVDIRVYVDYLAEGAKEFQLANAPQLKTWVDEEAATLTYYPVAMLTSKSNGTKYSVRAAAASACVATHAPDSFFAFNHALLSQQPAMESDGLTDRELADIAQAAGVESPKVVRACIEDETYTTWAKAATDRALGGLPATDGMTLTGTPTVLVNGKPYLGSLEDPAEFAQFVLTIASDAYYRTPTPTPEPTESGTPTPAP